MSIASHPRDGDARRLGAPGPVLAHADAVALARAVVDAAADGATRVRVDLSAARRCDLDTPELLLAARHAAHAAGASVHIDGLHLAQYRRAIAEATQLDVNRLWTAIHTLNRERPLPHAGEQP